MRRLFTSEMSKKINVTTCAWDKISKVLKISQGESFFFSANGGGCNGYNYEFRYIHKEEFDNIQNSFKIKPLVIENGPSKVLIDPCSEFLLLGTTIDYFEDIYESKFIFNRDKKNVTSCGCGTSFNIKNGFDS